MHCITQWSPTVEMDVRQVVLAVAQSPVCLPIVQHLALLGSKAMAAICGHMYCAKSIVSWHEAGCIGSMTGSWM
jgi:hypothetical protein